MLMRMRRTPKKASGQAILRLYHYCHRHGRSPKIDPSGKILDCISDIMRHKCRITKVYVLYYL
jgi:hypothetical protein